MLNAGGLVLFATRAAPALGSLSLSVGSLLALPVLSIVVQALVARSAVPGGYSMLVFVFFGLLCNLSLVALLIIALVAA